MRILRKGVFLNTFIRRLFARFPSKLPIGLSEFNEFSASIFDLYQIPDLPSYQQAIASMIMHLGPQTTHKSKRFFAKSIQKAMANQIAYEKINEIRLAEKMKDDEALEANEAAAH